MPLASHKARSVERKCRHVTDFPVPLGPYTSTFGGNIPPRTGERHRARRSSCLKRMLRLNTSCNTATRSPSGSFSSSRKAGLMVIRLEAETRNASRISDSVGLPAANAAFPQDIF